MSSMIPILKGKQLCFSEEDPSDVAFFVAEGDGEPEFDEDDEGDDKGYDENRKFDEFEENDMGLFVSSEYDEVDKEVDAVWETIDKMMDSRRKNRREARLKQEIEKYRALNQQMRTRMSDVSIEPITVAEYFESEFFPIIRSGAWANICFRLSMEDVYGCVDTFISRLLERIRGRILSTNGRMMRHKTWQISISRKISSDDPVLRKMVSKAKLTALSYEKTRFRPNSIVYDLKNAFLSYLGVFTILEKFYVFRAI
ncbi:hypothetical protein CDL15_Pgr021120 [Punica granatum]|uniref:PRP1 splicing factor N-terminal domain-containing protein n=1 Tax=Punica granatum TaxID=22663 RepID=A0A218WIZ3_PUNGR|nr:hypothetical protein CDL15_Pgr021120 [Punica granatum]